MKKVVSLGLAFSLALGGVLPTLSVEPSKVEASSYEFTKEQQEALDYINEVRKNIGLKPVKLNPFLIKAAENHANYLFLNKTTGHSEISGNKGFTGKFPSDRVKAVGGSSLLEGGIAEGIGYGKNKITDGIKEFLDTAYHREPLVHPDLENVGVAINNGIVVLVYAYSADSQNNEISIYPYDGQKDVPIGFYGFENPNPLEKFKVSKSGYIISFSAPSVYTENIDVKITDSKGNSLPFFLENGWGIWFIYPKNELAYGEKYIVSVNYKDDLEENAPIQNKTWSFTTVKSGTSTPTTPPQQTPSKPKVVYADYKDGQYWSEAMLWAIDKGYITGYMNVKNPKTGKVENLLKPMDTLTEGQFLTILFRYLYPDELKNTKPKDPKFDLSVVYQMAEKYKLPTKANFKNRADAYKPISRGTMARILASAHYKKVVTEKDAVKFMYDAKITNGYPDKNGKYPKTYESFGVKENLLRAHIVVFLKNYDTYLQNNKKQVVNGITVDYGRHTYGVKNQAEYNKVMEIVRNELKRVDKEPWMDGRFAKYYDMYLNGDRKENYKVGSLEYRGLLQAENSLGDLVSKGVSKEEIKKVYKLGMIASDLLQGATDPRNGKPSSAYDALVNKLSDCDSDAQVYSAVYDAMGYNTMILAGKSHADAFVQIGNNWYEAQSLDIADMSKPLSKDGYVLVQPTNGDIYNKDGTFTKAKK
ncbi:MULTISPECIES: CAP domain-containing protein [Geobacillus thermoleovorans group]|nr:CAP domain-containing protein [Geobacillus kaustophilus]MED4974254.1 CAP domain-containing protein [Geobacillus thermoleovorans]